MKQSITIYVALLGCLALVACSSKEASSVPVPVVYVSQVLPIQTSVQRILSGSLQPAVEAELSFRVGGQLIERRVDLGIKVRKGDVMARIDSTDYRLGMLAAQQEYEAAQVDARQNQLDAERMERLVADGAIGRAEAERQRSRSDAAAARLIQAEQQLELQQKKVRYTNLVAPFDGVVTSIRAEQGQVVSEGFPVLALAKSGDIEAVIDVPEGLVGRIKTMTASVKLTEQQQGLALPAKLSEIASSAHPTTRTYRVRYEVPNAPDDWLKGMSVTVVLQESRQETDGVTIQTFNLPVTALLNRGDSTIVWAVEDSTENLMAIPVQIVQHLESSVWVTGLATGTKVVTLGAHKLDEGMKVRSLLREDQSGTSKAGV